MSGNVPINSNRQAGAPTPVNTPLTASLLSGGGLPPTLSRPTVPDVSEEDVEEITTDGAINSTLMQALVASRIQNLIGRSSGYIESLSDDVKKTIEGLKGVDVEYMDAFKEFKKESLALEAKWVAKFNPIFTRRSNIINGSAKPTDTDVAKGVEVSKEDDDEYEPIAASVSPAANGIPDFWLTALRNHVGISELISERDEKALAALKDIRSSIILEPVPGHKLEFEFGPNEYFSNTILTKTYYYAQELDHVGDYVYDRAEGCKIDWKDDEKDLTKSIEIKKQRNKNTNRTRLVRKAHAVDSFFNFFSPPTPPASEDIDEDDEEAVAELEEIEQQLELDYQIGEDLKEQVIPRAIDFFTGKALEYEDLDEDDFEDLDDDDDDDQDDDDDEDEDDDLPARRRAPRAGQAAPTADECKQQ